MKFVSQSLSSFLPAVEGGILQPCPRGRLQFDGERANAASGALDGRLFSTGMFSGMFTEMDWGPFQTHFRAENSAVYPLPPPPY